MSNFTDLQNAQKISYPYEIILAKSYRAKIGTYLSHQGIRKEKDYRRDIQINKWLENTEKDSDIAQYIKKWSNYLAKDRSNEDIYYFKKASHLAILKLWLPDDAKKITPDFHYIFNNILGRMISFQIANEIIGVKTGADDPVVFETKFSYDPQ